MRPSGDKKKPLFRKVNTRTHGVRHGCTRLAGRDRNSKAAQVNPPMQAGMRQGLQHGLDYTPLFRFLVSRVGQVWDTVFSEAVGRLDQQEPIWHIVARSDLEMQPMVRVGESSYFSGLYVDDDGVLAKVAPTLEAQSLQPFCVCCTHTFNGEAFGLPFEDPSMSTDA